MVLHCIVLYTLELPDLNLLLSQHDTQFSQHNVVILFTCRVGGFGFLAVPFEVVKSQCQTLIDPLLNRQSRLAAKSENSFHSFHHHSVIFILETFYKHKSDGIGILFSSHSFIDMKVINHLSTHVSTRLVQEIYLRTCANDYDFYCWFFNRTTDYSPLSVSHLWDDLTNLIGNSLLFELVFHLIVQ